MNKIDLYHNLPLPLKSTAASLWGYYLRWLRYGPETERLVKEAEERETWSRVQWTHWQEERLAFILNLAATTVPYYKEQWQNRRRNGDRSSWERLQNWPKLDKDTVRKNPHLFISERSKGKRLYQEHTGGTTGKPTLIYLSRNVIRQWFALYEARTRRWLGLDYEDRWGILGGKKVIPLKQRESPYWVWNKGLNQVYFSIFHINKDTAKDYIDAFWHYRPKYLIAYPSALAVLSKFILNEGLRPPPLKAIISNSEKLLDHYRVLIFKAFNCSIMDTFGMVEMLAQTSECSQKRMHFWPETGVVEKFDPDNGQITSDSSPGLYCMTGLLNKDMPLIRYINGDFGGLPNWLSCTCGRTLPIMDDVQGRSNDLIVTRDGRKLYILDSLWNGLPIVEAQLIQKSLDLFEVKVVPGDDFHKVYVEEEIQHRLKEYMGEVVSILTEVKDIKRNSNGKYKPFISKLDPVG